MTNPTEKTEQEALTGNIMTLTASIEKQGLLWFVFVRGIVYGVGFVIGTTVVAAILIGVFIQLFGDVSFVENLITFIRSYR